MSDIIISETDFKFLQEAYEMKKSLDVLGMLDIMEYDITAELIEEIIDIHGLDIPEIKNVTMQFYVQPGEKHRLGKILKNKIHEHFGGYFSSILYSFKFRKMPRYYQESKDLVPKRITLSKYVRDLVVRSTILNCTSYEEIINYSWADNTFK